MTYNKITTGKGKEMASHVWNIFLSKDPEVFVTPYGNRNSRYRSYFDIDGTIYLHLNNQEIKELFGECVVNFNEIFLYGAFNQVYVKQIKILGKLSQLNNGGIVLQSIHDRLVNGQNGADKLKLKPNRQEVSQAVRDLQEGSFFRLTPISYELGEYETG